MAQPESQIIQSRDIPGEQYFGRNFEEPVREMPEAANDGEDSPDGELYYDIYAPSRTNRYIDSLESKQKISGCMFGIIGTIVLGFGIFLIHKGATS